LNFIKVSPYVQDLLIGLVIVGSAWIDANKRRKSG
jgi:ribose/xylose/arabinose/galactoside ABC-type transport system permease subunit